MTTTTETPKRATLWLRFDCDLRERGFKATDLSITKVGERPR